MAPKQPCAKYQYVLTASGPKIVPVPDSFSKDEESPADYNSGGYLPVKLRDTFKDGRYHVLRKLGWGHFSTVWLVKDTVENRHAALKVVKSAGRYAETARDEIKLLREVMNAKPGHIGREHIVSFLDSFQHCGPEDIHVCIVFEPLGENLLALIERHRALGVPVALVKVIAKQVLLGLQYLHDECDLVHTDIKPENIMVSIPDVESHIQEELSQSPSPTSRKVGIPPKHSNRPTVAIPRRGTGRERHVQIFDSQPLSSRLHSASSSPSTRHGLAMSRINSAQSFQSPRDSKGKGKQGIADSGASHLSTPDLSDSSPSLLSFTTTSSSDTAPTSLGSIMSGIKQLSMSSPDASKTCTCLTDAFDDTANDDASNLSTSVQRTEIPPAKPSLLSQTAPHDLHEHRCLNHDPHPPVTNSPPAASPPPPLRSPISVKIADLGNATHSRRHYTEDIQTRQYRSPEAILGRTDWGCNTDIWSVACVIFELLTAEYLFDPQSQGDVFGKDDDHMAQIIELLGDFSDEAKFGGRFSREIFDSSGKLRYIRNLKPWPLKRVMMEKYLWNEADSAALCEFLEPMLVVDQRERANARDMVDHPWVEVDLSSEDLSAW
ncbi:Pkinase-domain-containing protein [Cristinia sonorae]|uniref:non-specific serine/threonine protein kinase n=1 Tax=Cristinia sonorae TaxID=1940300 RepID=A0A8K0XL28_9AGAR|nr:Pkinase-domain-containing protein [Cristinia sonorae]